jgi:hypothetical protein
MPSSIMTLALAPLIFILLVSLHQIHPSCVLIFNDVPKGKVLVTYTDHLAFQLITILLVDSETIPYSHNIAGFCINIKMKRILIMDLMAYFRIVLRR